jgi:diketogulonate reductase-like aldo/keto reductase
VNGVRQLALPAAGRTVPVIGQGTWGMGEDRRRRAREVEALRLGIDLGMTLLDTAELYGAGGAEEVVGEAIADCRDRVFVVTKVWPSHADYRAAQRAVRDSLRRLRTERVDAVLLHWPTRSVPLAETLRALADLQAAGAIGWLGVSNFGPSWLRRLEEAAAGLPERARPVFNQVPYSLRDRRVERAVLPWARGHGQVVMAYSPLGHRAGLRRWTAYPALAEIAAARAVTPEQVALAYLTAEGDVVAIPRAVRPEHVRANAEAGDLALTERELRLLRGGRGPGPAGLRILPPYGAFFGLVWGILRLRGRWEARRPG